MLSTFHAASLRSNSSHCYDRGLRSTTYLALGTDFTALGTATAVALYSNIFHHSLICRRSSGRASIV